MSDSTGARNLQWSMLMMEELVRAGVRHCSLASGSRSAPLAVAAARQSGLMTVVHVDERGAAFHALGVARASGVPAVWITTSGSAVANGMPAVMEAAAARVPLLLLTADRPPELRATGANQTLDQVKIFGNAVRWQFDVPCPTEAIAPAFVLTTIDQAVHRTRSSPAGPVHLNCMFREPLLPAPDAPVLLDPPSLAAWRGSRLPFTRWVAPPVGAPDPTALEGAMRGLVVAGELRQDVQRRAARALAERLQWPLLPDVLSGLRLGGGGANVSPYCDQLLMSERHRSACVPDTVIHVGGPLTSKRLLTFLRDCAPVRYLRLQDHPERHDPNHQVSRVLEGDVASLCDGLAAGGTPIAPDPGWLPAWTAPSQAIAAVVDDALAGHAQLTEPGVARAVSRLLPAGHGLVLASSMPVRDMDMYGVADGAARTVIANRGASGIDGTLASAAGVAAGLAAPVTVVLGDLAFLHDLNSLALIARSLQPVTVVVVNNDGGGIFSFLPPVQHADVFERLFGTPHGLHFADAARLFGLRYQRPDSPAAFAAAYRAAAAGAHSTVIEVSTDRTANVRVHEELQARVRVRLA